MGWTHHWERPLILPPEQFAQFSEDCRSLLHSKDVAVAGPEGTGDPIIGTDEVAFNGRSPLSCEPFEFRRVEHSRHRHDRSYFCCKTQHLPYDRFVQAVLIIAKHYFQHTVLVTSDGNDSAWDDARQLVTTTLGYGSAFVLDDAKV
jgi:hypothetical protein